MSASTMSTSSIDTIIFSPNLSSNYRIKTIHLNTDIQSIDLRTTAICPSPARSHRLIQSDGTQDDSGSRSPSPSRAHRQEQTQATTPNEVPKDNAIPQPDKQGDGFPATNNNPDHPPPSSPEKVKSTHSSPSPGSQGHPPRVPSSLPPTPSTWSPIVHPNHPPGSQRVQRANSNPAISTQQPPIILSPQPIRRRVSASPSGPSPSPPSKLQTMQTTPIDNNNPPPFRRQGSTGADLSPIEECRAISAVECDSHRRVRMEREAKELALLQADFLRGDDEVAEMEEEKLHRTTPSSRRVSNASKTVSEEKADAQAWDKKQQQQQHKASGGGGGKKMHNCIRLARGQQEKSYGRVFADPFSAAMVLLVLPFCPPLSVYLTFRECGGLNGHRSRELGVAVLLTVLGWVPGLIYALVVYFRHLPRPNDPQENQALHLSPRQRSRQFSDVLSDETGRTTSNGSK